MATTYVYRQMDLSADSGYTLKFIFSAWVRRSGLGAINPLMSLKKDASNTASRLNIYFAASNRLAFELKDSGGSDDSFFDSSRVFRDTGAWYHIFWRYDSTDGTAADRLQLWVNGVRETDFASQDEPGSEFGSLMSSDMQFRIGKQCDNSGNDSFFDGTMACVLFNNYQSGTVPAVTDFGETDATTGQWKIKTDPSVTYGTQGCFLKFESSANLDLDSSSNALTMTTGGTLTQTEDCPSNVFCTGNPLYTRPTNKDVGLNYGNTEVWINTATDKACSGTLAASKGKYYWEQKVLANDGAGTNVAVVGALHTTEDWAETPGSHSSANTCGIRQNGDAWKDTTDLGNFTTAPVGGDIFGIAFDADNGTVKYWRNGTALNSGNAIVTGLDTTKTWIPYFVAHAGTGNARTISNFGNGYFQGTAVTSAGTNASGNGIFEYDVPAGYTALSTKGLNS